MRPSLASHAVWALMVLRLVYIVLLPGLAVGSLAIDRKRTSVVYIVSVALLYVVREQSMFAFPVALPLALHREGWGCSG